jgi:thiol:disulfide interchange protein
MRFEKKWIRELAVWGAIAAAVYFGNVQVQTWLGHRALAATGLEVHALLDGLELARSEEKPVLADLSAIWCSSCRKFDGEVLSDPQVRRRIHDDFVFVRVEYESEEGQAFRERHGLKGFPNLVLLDGEGELIRRLPTTYDPQRFEALLRQHTDSPGR